MDIIGRPSRHIRVRRRGSRPAPDGRRRPVRPALPHVRQARGVLPCPACARPAGPGRGRLPAGHRPTRLYARGARRHRRCRPRCRQVEAAVVGMRAQGAGAPRPPRRRARAKDPGPDRPRRPRRRSGGQGLAEVLHGQVRRRRGARRHPRGGARPRSCTPAPQGPGPPGAGAAGHDHAPEPPGRLAEASTIYRRALPQDEPSGRTCGPRWPTTSDARGAAGRYEPRARLDGARPAAWRRTSRPAVRRRLRRGQRPTCRARGPLPEGLRLFRRPSACTSSAGCRRRAARRGGRRAARPAPAPGGAGSPANHAVRKFSSRQRTRSMQAERQLEDRPRRPPRRRPRGRPGHGGRRPRHLPQAAPHGLGACAAS